ncbi:MAG: MCP four helix bundle domain-containing protein, partial [Gemmatimonadaceae bacterium]
MTSDDSTDRNGGIRSMSLRARLYAAFGLVTVLFAGVIGLGLQAHDALEQRLDATYQGNADATASLGEAQSAMGELRYTAALFMAAVTPEDQRRILDAQPALYRRLESAVVAYGAAAAGARERALVARWNSAFGAYRDARQNWFELNTVARVDEAGMWQAATTPPSGDDAAAALDALAEQRRQAGRAEHEAGAVAAGESARIVLGLGALAVVLAIVICLLTVRLVTRPVIALAEHVEVMRSNYIADLRDAIERMARGDLRATPTKDVPDLRIGSRDELGALARSVNEIAAQTMETMRSFVTTRATVQRLVDETRRVVAAAEAGRLAERGDATAFDGVYHDLVDGLNGTLDAVVGPITEASAVLARVAERDLTARMIGAYRGDFATIKDSINTAVDNLEQALGAVVVTSEQVAGAAAQIGGGSQSLAQGASEQASTLEEVSSSMQELSSMVSATADHAARMKLLMADIGHEMNESMGSMGRLTT